MGDLELLYFFKKQFYCIAACYLLKLIFSLKIKNW